MYILYIYICIYIMLYGLYFIYYIFSQQFSMVFPSFFPMVSDTPVVDAQAPRQQTKLSSCGMPCFCGKIAWENLGSMAGYLVVRKELRGFTTIEMGYSMGKWWFNGMFMVVLWDFEGCSLWSSNIAIENGQRHSGFTF